LIIYADNTTILTKNRDFQTLEIESFTKINELAQYFSDNKLSLNPEKTNYILFQTTQRQNRSLDYPHLAVGETQLQGLESTKFLGVILDHGLNWNEHVKQLSTKISAGLFVLRHISSYGNRNLSKLVYHGLIESFISYSIVLWGKSSKQNLNAIFKLQKRAIRYICKLRARDHCSDAFKQLNILTVPSIYIYETILFVVKNNQLVYQPHITITPDIGIIELLLCTI